jgi:hypothetical protein
VSEGSAKCEEEQQTAHQDTGRIGECCMLMQGIPLFLSDRKGVKRIQIQWMKIHTVERRNREKSLEGKAWTLETHEETHEETHDEPMGLYIWDKNKTLSLPPHLSLKRKSLVLLCMNEFQRNNLLHVELCSIVSISAHVHRSRITHLDPCSFGARNCPIHFGDDMC